MLKESWDFKKNQPKFSCPYSSVKMIQYFGYLEGTILNQQPKERDNLATN
jgi:hypothetical protein